jgi:hypothetical protein
LLGLGGYAFAKLTEEEEIKAILGVPQRFRNIGRLNEYRLQHIINKCRKEYTGWPVSKMLRLLKKENIESRSCNNSIAPYCNFNNTRSECPL